ncbi:MAG: hypothetical protein H8D94_00160 [Candidatus Pelagibacter sp.]|nr:hypothetical protein [Candidatus Pelagibacter sp.]
MDTPKINAFDITESIARNYEVLNMLDNIIDIKHTTHKKKLREAAETIDAHIEYMLKPLFTELTGEKWKDKYLPKVSETVYLGDDVYMGVDEDSDLGYLLTD